MASIFRVLYPSGEIAEAYGHPGQTLRVGAVPRGPEACYGDLCEVEPARHDPFEVRLLRVVGGPRRKTLHVRVTGDRDAWMDARDSEGWATLGDPDEPQIVWVVADRDDAELAALLATGAELVSGPIG